MGRQKDNSNQLSRRAGSNRMKFSALFIFSLALLSFATLAEAGCNENGCCYCGSKDGAVIRATQGQFRENCQPGFYCLCGWNSYSETFFGECTNDFEASNGNFANSDPNGK